MNPGSSSSSSKSKSSAQLGSLGKQGIMSVLPEVEFSRRNVKKKTSGFKIMQDEEASLAPSVFSTPLNKNDHSKQRNALGELSNSIIKSRRATDLTRSVPSVQRVQPRTEESSTRIKNLKPFPIFTDPIFEVFEGKTNVIKNEKCVEQTETESPLVASENAEIKFTVPTAANIQSNLESSDCDWPEPENMHPFSQDLIDIYSEEPPPGSPMRNGDENDCQLMFQKRFNYDFAFEDTNAPPDLSEVEKCLFNVEDNDHDE